LSDLASHPPAVVSMITTTFHEFWWVRWVICPVCPTQTRDITSSGSGRPAGGGRGAAADGGERRRGGGGGRGGGGCAWGGGWGAAAVQRMGGRRGSVAGQVIGG